MGAAPAGRTQSCAPPSPPTARACRPRPGGWSWPSTRLSRSPPCGCCASRAERSPSRALARPNRFAATRRPSPPWRQAPGGWNGASSRPMDIRSAEPYASASGNHDHRIPPAGREHLGRRHRRHSGQPTMPPRWGGRARDVRRRFSSTGSPSWKPSGRGVFSSRSPSSPSFCRCWPRRCGFRSSPPAIVGDLEVWEAMFRSRIGDAFYLRVAGLSCCCPRAGLAAWPCSRGRRPRFWSSAHTSRWGNSTLYRPRQELAAIVFLHLAAVAFWFGSLLPLRQVAARPMAMRRADQRWSKAAAAAVALADRRGPRRRLAAGASPRAHGHQLCMATE